jgi:hypothetical protein
MRLAMPVLYELRAAVDIGTDEIAVAARLPGHGREGHQTMKRTVESRCQYGKAVEVFGAIRGKSPAEGVA